MSANKYKQIPADPDEHQSHQVLKKKNDLFLFITKTQFQIFQKRQSDMQDLKKERKKEKKKKTISFKTVNDLVYNEELTWTQQEFGKKWEQERLLWSNAERDRERVKREGEKERSLSSFQKCEAEKVRNEAREYRWEYLKVYALYDTHDLGFFLLGWARLPILLNSAHFLRVFLFLLQLSIFIFLLTSMLFPT